MRNTLIAATTSFRTKVNLPVVGTASESIVEESKFTFDCQLVQERGVLVESKESEERESQHPDQHSWNSDSEDEVVVTTGRDPAFLR